MAVLYSNVTHPLLYKAAGHHGNTAINQCETFRTAGYNRMVVGLYALYIIV